MATSASLPDPTVEQVEATTKARPMPLGSLVASARRITTRTIRNKPISASGKTGWQDDAWEMFDLVGEHRFLATTLANRLSQARFYIGKVSPDPTEPPVPVDDDETVAEILQSIGGSAAARAQMVARLGVNLFTAGDGWLAGIPKSLFPQSLLPTPSLDVEPEPAPSAARTRIPTTGTEAPRPTLDINDLEWRMLSVSEVTSNAGGEVTLLLGEAEGERITCRPEDIWLVRVWRPHPRKWWEADSPTRSSLPVLREIVGLTMHISAQVDSRLAGAGLLIVPQSAQRALKIAAGLSEDDDSDPFVEGLMEAMLTPISDRANASALVPLVVTVPDDATGLFNFITFAKPLDSEARSLRDEAIRRYALGSDAPPELLLGVGGMNHWGAWLVREDVVTTHTEPPLALICDAVTTQFLWPVLNDLNYDDAHEYVLWYDVSHMITRPNRATDALTLYDKGVISDETLRDANGFGASDAPEEYRNQPIEVTMGLELCKSNPALFSSPGLQAVVEQIRATLAGEFGAPSSGPGTDSGEPAGTTEPEPLDPEEEGTDDTPESTDGETPTAPGGTAAPPPPGVPTTDGAPAAPGGPGGLSTTGPDFSTVYLEEGTEEFNAAALAAFDAAHPQTFAAEPGPRTQQFALESDITTWLTGSVVNHDQPDAHTPLHESWASRNPQ